MTAEVDIICAGTEILSVYQRVGTDRTQYLGQILMKPYDKDFAEICKALKEIGMTLHTPLKGPSYLQPKRLSSATKPPSGPPNYDPQADKEKK